MNGRILVPLILPVAICFSLIGIIGCDGDVQPPSSEQIQKVVDAMFESCRQDNGIPEGKCTRTSLGAGLACPDTFKAKKKVSCKKNATTEVQASIPAFAEFKGKFTASYQMEGLSFTLDHQHAGNQGEIECSREYTKQEFSGGHRLKVEAAADAGVAQWITAHFSGGVASESTIYRCLKENHTQPRIKCGKRDDKLKQLLEDVEREVGDLLRPYTTVPR